MSETFGFRGTQVEKHCRKHRLVMASHPDVVLCHCLGKKIVSASVSDGAKMLLYL